MAKPRKKERRSRTTFSFEADPGVKQVFIAGEFNDWDPSATPMNRRNGVFEKTLELPPGEHQYKFVVDGEWRIDPSAVAQVPNVMGSLNSVVRS